jgi:hypothetical protein
MTSPTNAAGAFVAYRRAGFASLEAAIVFAARAVVLSYPALHKVQRPNEPPEIATARDFVHQCELVLAALDAHWYAVTSGLPAVCPVPRNSGDIPF